MKKTFLILSIISMSLMASASYAMSISITGQTARFVAQKIGVSHSGLMCNKSITQCNLEVEATEPRDNSNSLLVSHFAEVSAIAELYRVLEKEGNFGKRFASIEKHTPVCNVYDCNSSPIYSIILYVDVIEEEFVSKWE